jgi:cobalt/nickel transport system permease protein
MEEYDLSHIHLPDGVLPFAWWFAGDVLALLWLIVAERQVQKGPARRQLPLLAALGAMMLLTMSVPLGPLPWHLNLTVLTGILAGQWLGFIVVVVVNAMLSLLGHGGVTVLGLNSLIMGVEVSLGWWVFHRLLRRATISWRSLVAPVLALLVSITLSLSLVGVGTGLWTVALPHSHDDHLLTHEEISQPASGRVLSADRSLPTAVANWRLWGLRGISALGLLLGIGLLL